MIALIVEAAARSAALIIVAWLALIGLRIQNAHIEKALWTTIVVASLAMPVLLQLQIMPDAIGPLGHWTVGSGAASPTQPVTLQTLWNVVYLVPFVVLLLRLAIGWLRMSRIRQVACALDVPSASAAELDLRASHEISVPVTFGKTILVPPDFPSWSEPKRTAVIEHERAHVLHRDCYALWLARLTLCVLWFSPFIWWVVQRLSSLCEQTSDEAAVERLGSRADYAEFLLALGAQRSSPLGVAMSRSHLPARIERVLAGGRRSPALRWPHLALVIVAVLPAVAIAVMPITAAAAVAGKAVRSPATVQSVSGVPRVISWGPLASYYPTAAKRKGIDGVVELAVTLDRKGRATDTKILLEKPLDMGFGAAASAAAHAMRYSNPTGHPVVFDVRIRFALEGHLGRSNHSTPEK